jgi:hypothetical protein
MSIVRISDLSDEILEYKICNLVFMTSMSYVVSSNNESCSVLEICECILEHFYENNRRNIIKLYKNYILLNDDEIINCNEPLVELKVLVDTDIIYGFIKVINKMTYDRLYKYHIDNIKNMLNNIDKNTPLEINCDTSYYYILLKDIKEFRYECNIFLNNLLEFNMIKSLEINEKYLNTNLLKNNSSLETIYLHISSENNDYQNLCNILNEIKENTNITKLKIKFDYFSIINKYNDDFIENLSSLLINNKSLKIFNFNIYLYRFAPDENYYLQKLLKTFELNNNLQTFIFDIIPLFLRSDTNNSSYTHNLSNNKKFIVKSNQQNISSLLDLINN